MRHDPDFVADQRHEAIATARPFRTPLRPALAVHARLTPACSAVHRGEDQRDMLTPEQPSVMRFPMNSLKCKGPGGVRKDNSRRPSP